MNDFYTEQLVKKKKGMKEMMLKVLLIVLSVLSVAVVFFIPFGIIIPVIVIAVTVLMFFKLDVEYEYLYVNGDLDIDKIMHKAKRKRIFSVNVNDVELLAPVNSGELRQYQRAKTYDYSSGVPSDRSYVLVTKEKGQLIKVLFEPNKVIVDGIFMMAPRKVIK